MANAGWELRIVAVGVPWLAALVAAVFRRQSRSIAFAAALVATTASLFLLRIAPASESLDEVVMLLYSAIAVGATMMIAKRDCTPSTMSGMLVVLGSTLLAYSSENLLVLLAAWAVSSVPFFVPALFGRATARTRVALGASSLALAAAVAVIATADRGTSIGALRGQNPGGVLAFALLVAAVVFRKGIFPAHIWVADAVEHGPAVPTAFFLNGHLGAFLVAKVIMPLFPRTSPGSLALLSYLAMGTAVLVAIRALTENAPRKLLGFVALSQSACILAGLESQTTEGMTGALVHWCVVSVSTVAMFGIVRLLEVRFGENLTASRHFGLAENAPRLAVSFLVFGLALVGLPGTLSFCSQDLLIHGTLASHPHTGLLLPIATAMNAISVFRLFTRLFLGKRRTGFTIVADALPRERWILAAGLVFVVLGGLFPNAMVALQSAEAETVARGLSNGATIAR